MGLNSLPTMPNETKHFLRLLDPKSDSFTFQVFDDGPDKKKLLAKTLNGSLDQLADQLNDYQKRGAGVFVTVNKTDGQARKAENIVAVRAVFIDLDGPPLGSVLNATLKPHILVESSPGKWHAYWLVDDCPIDRFRAVQRCLAEKFDGDKVVTDLSRVMRLPGFLHLKGKPYQTKLMSEFCLNAPPYSLAIIVAKLGLDISHDGKVNLGVTGKVLAGGRNDHLFRLGRSLGKRGSTPDEVRASLVAENERCEPPLTDTELMTVIRNVLTNKDAPDWLDEPIYMRTDMGNAQRFAAQHGADVRFIPEFKKWMSFSKEGWKFDKNGSVMMRVKKTARSIYVEAEKAKDTTEAKAFAAWAATSQSLPRAQAMIELAKSEKGITLASCELDRDPFLFGVANGVVDLRTGQLRPNAPADYITKRAGVSFSEGATCPLWDQFLNQIFGSNIELIDFLARAVGYSLTGDVGEQCLFFAYGHGANGKTTLIEVLRFVFGDYATTSSTDLLMTKNNQATNDVARLRGARFVAAVETEDGRKLAEGLVKQITGGDTISARFLFKEFFEFKPQFKIWLAANHKPVIRGDDLAIWRRILLVPFSVTIPQSERDQRLVQKLIDEADGILQWAIRGCLEWQRIGLAAPDTVRAATDTYRSEQDTFGQWVEECCRTGQDATAAGGRLYSSYKAWVERNGARPLSNPLFATKLAERGFPKEKKGTVIYLGIALLEGSEGSDSFLPSSSNSPSYRQRHIKASNPPNPPKTPADWNAGRGQPRG